MCASCTCGVFATLRENPTPLSCRIQEPMRQFICSDLGGVDLGRGGLHAAPNLVSQPSFLFSSVSRPQASVVGVSGDGGAEAGAGSLGGSAPIFRSNLKFSQRPCALHMRRETFCDRARAKGEAVKVIAGIASALAASARLRERDTD
jgi:hypothetical protein